MTEFPVDSDPDLDTIVESFASACRRGEHPEIGTWLERYPVFASELNELLPAVMLLEKDGPTEAGPGAHRTPAPPEIPERIGDYRLVREIGRGGMGVVFEAIEEPLGRRVALKVLPALHLAGAEERARFQREAEVASRLDHPGICTVYRAGVGAGVPFLAMRFVDGATLGQILRRSRDEEHLPQSRAEITAALRLAEGVARALHHAHEAGVVHRDIKPQNIMVDPRGDPVILDFGLARDLGGDATVTRTGALCGTPAYLAPEALRAGKSVPAPVVDIYSLGSTLFEVLTLRRPFEGPTLDALYHAILHDEPPDARRLNPSLGRDTHAVLATALAKEPSRRYGTALAFAEDLRALIEGRPVSVRPPSLLGRGVRWARREPAKALQAAALAILVPVLAAVGGFLTANLPQIRRGEMEASRDRVEAALEAGFIGMDGMGGTDAIAAFRAALREDSACVEAQAGLVLAHLYDSRSEAALAALDSRRDLESLCPTLGLLREMALRGSGRLEEAKRAAGAVPAPISAVDWFISGLRALDTLERGDIEPFKRARDHLQRAAGLCPVARSYYLGALAYAASLAGDRTLTEATSEALLGLWPDRAGSWYWRALALYPFDAAVAEAASRRALTLDGGLVKAMDLLGTLLSWRGEHQEAVALHRRVVEANPGSGIALCNLAATLRAAGCSATEALELNRRASDLAPRSPRIRRALGAACWAVGDLEGALESYRVAADLAPWFADNWIESGKTHAELGHHEEAAAAFARAIKCRPGTAEGYHGLGRAKYFLDDDAGAIAALSEAARLEPGRAGSLAILAAAHSRSGNKPEALAAARQAFRLDPRADHIHNNFLLLLEQQGRLDGILEAAQQRVAEFPSDARVTDLLGSAFLRLGRFEEAEAEFRRAIERDPDLAEAHFHLGEALRLAGRFPEAVEAARRGSEAELRRPAPHLKAAGLMKYEESMAQAAELVRRIALGGPVPADTEQQLKLAWVALVSGDAALARKLYQAIESEAPERLIDRMALTTGYFGAVAAVTVATGGGAALAGDGDRSSLLQEAHRFLREQLDAEREPSGIPIDRSVRERWLRWLNDPRLKPVRDAAQLQRLPEPDRRCWALLWEDARRFLADP